jgi:hypothetical protein
MEGQLRVACRTHGIKVEQLLLSGLQTHNVCVQWAGLEIYYKQRTWTWGV